MNGLNSTGTRSNWFCGWGSKLRQHLYLRVVEWTFCFFFRPPRPVAGPIATPWSWHASSSSYSYVAAGSRNSYQPSQGISNMPRHTRSIHQTLPFVTAIAQWNLLVAGGIARVVLRLFLHVKRTYQCSACRETCAQRRRHGRSNQPPPPAPPTCCRSMHSASRFAAAASGDKLSQQ
jgi:hypothetical protein